MPTPEQQPNTSNLQSLESELSLTKQELDEFRKLPKEEQDRQKDEKLLELQKLNDKLDVAMQEAIRTGHLDEAIKLKEQLEKEVNDLGEKVEGTESPEANIPSLKRFLKETFSKWYKRDIDIPQRPSFVDLHSLNWETLKADIDPSKFGEYTLNPECIGLDFETIKIKVLDIQKEIKDHNLTDLASIGKYVIDTYSKDYIIPDLTFWQWMIEKGASAPAELLDKNILNFCFGSILHGLGGDARVPCVSWFDRHANPLDYVWGGHYRVVLLER